jgi:hypothetical protein
MAFGEICLVMPMANLVSGSAENGTERQRGTANECYVNGLGFLPRPTPFGFPTRSPLRSLRLGGFSQLFCS